jgi:Ni,Fe-hydrogenase III large subunit
MRLAQISESVRLVRNRLGGVPDGAVSVPLPAASGEALGFAEGPSGDVWHWLRLDHGQIASLFMRDPAWAHWPLLEVVLAGGESDALPLVMASFGLAVSGADL